MRHAWQRLMPGLHRASAIGAGIACLALGLLGPLVNPAAAIPLMARDEILARAESGLGTDYTWAREAWVPNAGGVGPDCSGYVLKAWEVPRSLLYEEEDPDNSTISPRYTTYEFFNNQGPWSSLPDRSYLKTGDILVRNNGSSGHVVIYGSGDRWGAPNVYEAPGSGLHVRYVSRSLSSDYLPKRRNQLTEGTLILDNPTAKTTGGTGLAGTWSRSTSTAGYYQDDYQTRAGCTGAAWARWTPRFSTTAIYAVYLRWTAGWNRATNAKVTINIPIGQASVQVNQQTNNGQWVYVGSYRFNAGYSTGQGSVAIHAQGANGYVVADAARFVPTP